MEFKSNPSAQNARRPEPQRPAAGPQEYHHSSGEGERMRGRRPSFRLLVPTIVLVVVLLVAVCGGFMWMKHKDVNGMTGIKKDQYQAVFLTNGQVYFGKVADMNSKQLRLTNIYYLQVQQSVQPADNKNTQVSLAKLGDELHGPEDNMYIARDQVLFWENLKDSGKVVQAIKGAVQK
ncbi:MAG TPA: hypothetical protein VLF60_04505 [Candidatus Saccharimonadales bacterium]|nr:hypothetical protein [Candidatus Saccharimonadales bacterium]